MLTWYHGGGVDDFLVQGMALAKEEAQARRQSNLETRHRRMGHCSGVGKNEVGDRGLIEEGDVGERGFPPNAKLPGLSHDRVWDMKHRGRPRLNSGTLTRFPFHRQTLRPGS